MKHFLAIDALSSSDIEQLIDRALTFKRHATAYPVYHQWSVANLFYENSTRTRVSFELAAKKLAMPVINLDSQQSSERKGEAIEDTVKTLAAMGINIMVIRHGQAGLPEQLAALCGDGVHVINAGDGQHAHPSQAMLDWMTMLEQKPKLSTCKIAIVGDIRHSRVAHSLAALCAIMGVGELVFVSPTLWQPLHVKFGHVTTSLKEGLAGADIVIALRIQHERLSVNEGMDLAHYRDAFAITQDHLRYAKADAMIMHPGPINRGVEIDSDVADGPQSFILQQVTNGVFMRMAILDALVNS